MSVRDHRKVIREYERRLEADRIFREKLSEELDYQRAELEKVKRMLERG